MLVFSMTYKEMYNCLEADKPKLDYQREKLLPKIINEFISENKFPNYKWVQYKPSSGNTYLIIYCANNIHQITKPFVRYCAIVWDDNYRFLLTWMMSKYKHPTKNKFEETPMLCAFTEHFLEQYNDRCLKDSSLSANDIIGRFLLRNPIFTPVEINEKINRNIGEKDISYTRGFEVSDGMCFTRYSLGGNLHDIDEIEEDEVDSLLFLFATYYNIKEMHPCQKEEIEKETAKSWKTFLNYQLLQDI